MAYLQLTTKKIKTANTVKEIFFIYKMKLKPERIEVMHFLAQKIDSIIDEFLKKIDTNWQPADFLPVSSDENFTKEIKELQAECKDLPYDYLAVFVFNCRRHG